MRPWSSPAQLSARAHPTGQGNSLGLRPVPPPRLRRASSRRDLPYPRPAESTLEMVGSKCQLGTPAASLCTADSPSQHRVMPPGPSSRANVSGFCFPVEPGSGTKRAWKWPFSSYSVLSPSPSPSPPLSVSLSLSVAPSLLLCGSLTLAFVG